jgi:hypothetical protein
VQRPVPDIGDIAGEQRICFAPVGAIVVGHLAPRELTGTEAATRSIVKGSTPEFDYPKGKDNVYTTYDGKDGIPLGHLEEPCFTMLIRPVSGPARDFGAVEGGRSLASSQAAGVG